METENPHNGKETNLEQEILSLQPMIMASFMKKGLRYHDAEDLAQVAIIKAVRHKDSFDGEHKLSTWVYEIARNTMFDWFRKKSTNSEIPSGSLVDEDEDEGVNRSLIQSLSESQEDPNIPGEDLVKEEDLQLVRELMDQLPPKYGDILKDKVLHGLNYEQLKIKYGIESGLVGLRINRAKAKLAKLVKEHKHFN